MNTMLSLYYPEYGKLEMSDQPVPEPADDEVLIQVKACGICGSELETFANKSERRTPPKIMGHEFCGIVVKTGDNVSKDLIGKRFVSNSVVSCGHCPECNSGKTNLCKNRQVFGMHRGGAFAEYVNVPERCLIPMEDGVEFSAASLTEPLANGVHIVNLTKEFPARKVLVIGAGPIGLMTQQAFQALRQAEVYVTDLKDARLKVAEQLGAKRTINSKNEAIREVIHDLTDGEGLDLVVDAVGMELTNWLGLELIKPGGVLVMIGLHQNSKPFNSYDIILSEKKIFGTYAATQKDMAQALDLITRRKVDVTSWVSHYPLSKGVTAFYDMLAADDDHTKGVIEMN